MGLTHIQATIANPARPRRTVRLKFFVDSGALYSVVPSLVLRRLGIRPVRTKSFILADGTEIKRSHTRPGRTTAGRILFSADREDPGTAGIF